MPQRSLSGHLEQVSPQAHLVQGTGAVVFAHSPRPVGKTLWATVFSGVPKIPQSRKSWEGQEGKQLSLDQHEDARPIPTLCSAPHLHTAFSQCWYKKPEAPLKLFPLGFLPPKCPALQDLPPGLPLNRSVLLKSPQWLPAFVC